MAANAADVETEWATKATRVMAVKPSPRLGVKRPRVRFQ